MSTRSAAIHKAATLPVGDPERKRLLAALTGQKRAGQALEIKSSTTMQDLIADSIHRFTAEVASGLATSLNRQTGVKFSVIARRRDYPQVRSDDGRFWIVVTTGEIRFTAEGFPQKNKSVTFTGDIVSLSSYVDKAQREFAPFITSA